MWKKVKLSILNLKKMFQLGVDIHEKVDANIFPHITCSAIAAAISHSKPLLVSRLGWFETYSIGYFDAHGEISSSLRKKMWNTPGIFPATNAQFENFYFEYRNAISKIDILALMRCPYEKSVITSYAPQAFRCELLDIEPYYNPVPWSRYLAGKKVLVVHPFVDTICKQYASVRQLLFVDSSVLPEFEITGLKPPQTMCGNTDGYDSWNIALDSLKNQIASIDFDVAIIGCGAYGLPVGGFVKELGKVCIHMGGATQTLFGVTGTRWMNGSPLCFYHNKFWTRPSEEERPANWQQAEGGCYW